MTVECPSLRNAPTSALSRKQLPQYMPPAPGVICTMFTVPQTATSKAKDQFQRLEARRQLTVDPICPDAVAADVRRRNWTCCSPPPHVGGYVWLNASWVNSF